VESQSAAVQSSESNPHNSTEEEWSMVATIKYVHAVVCPTTGNVLHGPVASSLEVYSTRENAASVRQARYNEAEVRPCVLVDEASYRALEGRAQEQLPDEAISKLATYAELENMKREDGSANASLINWACTMIHDRDIEHKANQGILKQAMCKGYRGLNYEQLEQFVKDNLLNRTPGSVETKVGKEQRDNLMTHKALHHLALNTGWHQDSCGLVRFFNEKLAKLYDYEKQERENADKPNFHENSSKEEALLTEKTFQAFKAWGEKCIANNKFDTDIEAAVNRITCKIENLRKHPIEDPIEHERCLAHYEDLLCRYFTSER
jgi:hypothetical protein